MTSNAHIIEALGRQRVSDLRREAAACRMAADRDRLDAVETANARAAARREGTSGVRIRRDAEVMSAAPTFTRGITMSTSLESRPRPRVTSGRLSAERVTDLITEAAAGDQRAWNGLVQQFGGMIWAVARAHRLRDVDASEVSQATWLRLLEHLGQLKEPACVGAWLATTARRECLRVLRENKRRVLYGAEAPECESPDMSADDVVLLSERDDALWRSFSRLRESDQALLRLLMTDPRPPYEEIAAALDMPIGSIGPTRQRALERLRVELAGHGTLNLMSD